MKRIFILNAILAVVLATLSGGVGVRAEEQQGHGPPPVDDPRPKGGFPGLPEARGPWFWTTGSDSPVCPGEILGPILPAGSLDTGDASCSHRAVDRRGINSLFIL